MGVIVNTGKDLSNSAFSSIWRESHSSIPVDTRIRKDSGTYMLLSLDLSSKRCPIINEFGNLGSGIV